MFYHTTRKVPRTPGCRPRDPEPRNGTPRTHEFRRNRIEERKNPTDASAWRRLPFGDVPGPRPWGLIPTCYRRFRVSLGRTASRVRRNAIQLRYHNPARYSHPSLGESLSLAVAADVLPDQVYPNGSPDRRPAADPAPIQPTRLTASRLLGSRTESTTPYPGPDLFRRLAHSER
jgi:hypothetical protein